MGAHAPLPLSNMMWFFTVKILGFRGTHETCQLCWGDLTLKTDEDGEEFLEWNEHLTKTRNGNTTHLRPFNPKIFPNDECPERCPVRAYKVFLKSKCPASMMYENSPFFLGLNGELIPLLMFGIEHNLWAMTN